MLLLIVLTAAACGPDPPELPKEFGYDVPVFPPSKFKDEYQSLVKVPGSMALEHHHTVRYEWNGNPLNVQKWYMRTLMYFTFKTRGEYWVFVYTPPDLPFKGKIEIRINFWTGEHYTIYEVVRITTVKERPDQPK